MARGAMARHLLKERIDKGALDCTVQARTIAAVYRAAGTAGEIDWKEIDAWNA